MDDSIGRTRRHHPRSGPGPCRRSSGSPESTSLHNEPVLRHTVRHSTLYCLRTSVTLSFHPRSPGAVCFACVGQEMIEKIMERAEKNVKTMLIGIRLSRVLLFAVLLSLVRLPASHAQNGEPFTLFRDYIGLNED